MAVAERLQNHQGREGGGRHGLFFFRRFSLGHDRPSSPKLGPSSIHGYNINGSGPDNSPVASSQISGQERYPAYRQHPAEVIFTSSVLLPRLAEAAERNSYGKSVAQKREKMAGLTDVYRIVQEHPDSLVDQMRALNNAGLSGDYDYLGQIKGMLPDFQAEKERIFAEAEGRSYKKNKRYARRSTRRVKRELGKDAEGFMPVKQELPNEMVTELAVMNRTWEIFHNDAVAAYKENHPKLTERLTPSELISKKDAINSHINGLLIAYAATEFYGPDALPDFDPVFMDRLQLLRPKIVEEQAKVRTEASDLSNAKKYKHVRSAAKHLTPTASEDILSLRRETGVNDEMISDAKTALLKEYAYSTLWGGAIEASQMSLGWAVGFVDKEFLDIKNIAILWAIVLSTKGLTWLELKRKIDNSVGVEEVTGVAIDPGAKFTAEQSGNPKKGAYAVHVPFEGVYAGTTVLAMATIGMGAALAKDAAENLIALPRQVIENAKMQEISGVWGVERRIVYGVKMTKDAILKAKKRNTIADPNSDIFVTSPPDQVVSPGEAVIEPILTAPIEIQILPEDAS